ncbi:MAG: hypothetical protein RLZZ86_3608 [Cyanobacteriota bacterium]|jgi:hypothetical protein
MKSERTGQIYIVKRIRLTMNKLILALLTVGAIATAAVPANAQDIGNVQTSDQTSVITGSGNYTNQNVNQKSNIRREGQGRQVPGDSANIQNARQNADVLGEGNVTVQDTKQRYEEKQRRTRQKQY